MYKILCHLQAFWLAISHPFRKTYATNVCGHSTKKTGKVMAHGESLVMSMTFSENSTPDCCLNCIAKMSIRCAWCGNPIHVGDPVTLYTPKKSFKAPEHAVRYDSCLVGCLGWNCADSGADRQRFWIPPGKVARVPSPIEILMSKGDEGNMAVFKDLSNPKDFGRVI